MMPPEFHFLRPEWFAALPLLAVLAWGLSRGNSGSGRWKGLVDAHLLPHLMVNTRGGRRFLPSALLGLGGVLLISALAGPTWERLPQPVYQAPQFRVILLDISPSMNAADLPPSRMARARFEVLDLLQRSSDGHTALIAFGAEPYIVSPLSTDTDTIALQVPSLSSELLPVQGKRAAPAIARALELLRQTGARDGQVILVSDGLNDPGAAREAARSLREAGHHLSVLAVGTREGAPVPGPDGGFLKDANGAIRIPRLDAQALRDLARSGGGRFVQSSAGDRDLDALDTAPSRLELQRTPEESARADQWREQGPWLLLLLLPIAALAFRRGWLSPLSLVLVLTISPPQPALAFGWTDLWSTADQQGAKALSADNPQEAAQRFSNPDWRAAAHYRAGDYEQALQTLEQGQGRERDYNRGNALARLGKLEEALEAYEQMLTQDPEHEDARHNRDLVEQLLKQSQEQNSDQSQDQNQQEDGEQGEQEQEQQQSADQQSKQDTRQNSESQDDPAEDQTSQAEGEQEKAPKEETESPEDSAAAQDRNDPNEQEQAEPQASDLRPQDEQPREAAASAQESEPVEEIPESAQAMEQWLRRVPDDPAGLLRQRFILQHLRYKGELP